ncbi:MAG: ATP-binding protein [Bacteroidota bacterium]
MKLSFKVKVFWRLLLISLMSSASWIILLQTPFFLAAFWTALFAVLLFADLIRFIDKEHREMRYFMEAIEQNDFSANVGNSRFSPKKYEMKTLYESVMGTFRRLRSEKESQHQFLQTLVGHIGVAIICYNSRQEVILINQAAKDLLGKTHWYKLDSLKTIDPTLLAIIRELPADERKSYSFSRNGTTRQLTLHSTAFKLLDDAHKLVALQDISIEMDSQELNSWQKLIRVLTHEINNSVIPVATLSKLTLELVEQPGGQSRELSAEDMEDLRGNLQVIAGRSQGLVRFVDEYKHLNTLSPLTLVSFPVKQLFQRIRTLLEPKLIEQGVSLQIEVPQEALILQADLEKIEQVLINLINNAIYALKGCPEPRINLSAVQLSSAKIQLQVSDNGKGIDPGIRDKVFTPFFTTKKEGSGIGLSLCRQIMNMHQGTLSLVSDPGKGTTFSLVF